MDQDRHYSDQSREKLFEILATFYSPTTPIILVDMGCGRASWLCEAAKYLFQEHAFNNLRLVGIEGGTLVGGESNNTLLGEGGGQEKLNHFWNQNSSFIKGVYGHEREINFLLHPEWGQKAIQRARSEAGPGCRTIMHFYEGGLIPEPVIEAGVVIADQTLTKEDMLLLVTHYDPNPELGVSFGGNEGLDQRRVLQLMKTFPNWKLVQTQLVYEEGVEEMAREMAEERGIEEVNVLQEAATMKAFFFRKSGMELRKKLKSRNLYGLGKTKDTQKFTRLRNMSEKIRLPSLHQLKNPQ